MKIFCWEKNLLGWIEKHFTGIAVALIVLLSLLIRYVNRGFVSTDALTFTLPWYDQIQNAGGLAALKSQVGDYNLLYQFLIALMTYLPFSSIAKYKALSILFDYALAYAVGKFAFLLVKPYITEKKSAGASGGILYGIVADERTFVLLVASAVCMMPSVIMNSSLWAQCDSIYTFFIVWALIALFKDQDILSMIMLGFAFSFKLQTIFVLPFFLIWYFYRRRFSVLNFLLIPVVMIVTSLPAVVYGRSVFDTFRIYFGQTDTYHFMAMNIPNIWLLMGGNYDYNKKPAVFVTIAVFIFLVWVLRWRKDLLDTPKSALSVMCFTWWTALMFLPGMHERYGYLLDVMLPLAALAEGVSLRMHRAAGSAPVRLAGYWIIAILQQIVSLITYSKYLFGTVYSPGPLSILYMGMYGCFACLLFGGERKGISIGNPEN